MVEIISPSPSAPARYSDRARISSSHEPFIGSPNSTIDASTIDHRRGERDGEVRQRLADDVGAGAERRHPHLLHRAALLLAHDRERRRDDRRNHADVGDEAGDEEQRAAKLRVVPDPRFDGDEPGRAAHGRLRLILRRRRLQHAQRVPHHGRRGIRVVAVDDHLHRHALAGEEISLEPGGITSTARTSPRSISCSYSRLARHVGGELGSSQT